MAAFYPLRGMDRGTEFDYAAAVEVRFFEDLTFRDVTPILDQNRRSRHIRATASERSVLTSYRMQIARTVMHCE